MEPISYANGSTLDDPAISYGIVFSNFMSKGVYTFTGGTDGLIRDMKGDLARTASSISSTACRSTASWSRRQGARRALRGAASSAPTS